MLKSASRRRRHPQTVCSAFQNLRLVSIFSSLPKPLREIATPDWVSQFKNPAYWRVWSSIRKVFTQSGVAISRKGCFPLGLQVMISESPRLARVGILPLNLQVALEWMHIVYERIIM